MPSASVPRLVREVSKDKKVRIRCAEKLNGRSGRCKSTIAIDGAVACKGGHIHSVEELIAASLGDDNPNTPLALFSFAAADKRWADASAHARAALTKILSPPFSTADSHSDPHYTWWQNDPLRLHTLLFLGDRVAPELSEALRRQIIERVFNESREEYVIDRALTTLLKPSSAQERSTRNQLLDLCLMRSFWHFHPRALVLHWTATVHAARLLNEDLMLPIFEDSLADAENAERYDYNPILYSHRDNNGHRTIFTFYLRGQDTNGAWSLLEARASIKIDDNGFGYIEANSGVLSNAPSFRALEEHLATVAGTHDADDGILRGMKGSTQPHFVVRDRSVLEQELWQLEIVKELRSWFDSVRVIEQPA